MGLDIFSRADKALKKSPIRSVGIKSSDENDEISVFTDRFGHLRKVKVPVKEEKPEPTEMLLNLKDDPNILIALKNYINSYLKKYDCRLWNDENDKFVFYWNKENCKFKIDPSKNWKLEFYSVVNERYLDIFEIIHTDIKLNFIKQVIDFNHFLMSKTIGEKKNLFPVGLWNEKDNLFYLNPWKLSALKNYFDLWNNSQSKKFDWVFFERVFKTLKIKPEFNKDKIRIKYYLRAFDWGYLSTGNLLNADEESIISKEINLFLEKIKMSFWTYRDYVEQQHDLEKRKKEIGF